MAGMVIFSGETGYDCSLKKNEIETVLVNGQEIPLLSLDVWKRCYELMGRKDRAELI